MRLWSIHPKYLDAKGLVALWREALLAKKVLQGKTKGYKNHPQLERFKACPDPVGAIGSYLSGVYSEACSRGYCFDKRKVGKTAKVRLKVTHGQLAYEFKHLLGKFRSRDKARYDDIKGVKVIDSHPMFSAQKGEIEPWERS